MKTVKLKTLTKVTLDAGTVVTVTDAEAWRLSAFGLADEVKDEPKGEPEQEKPEEPAPKTAKKTGTKTTTKKSTPKK